MPDYTSTPGLHDNRPTFSTASALDGTLNSNPALNRAPAHLEEPCMTQAEHRRDGHPTGTSGHTLGGLLARASARWPDTDALLFPGERVSYAQLEAAAVARARSLLALSIGQGDHVGILMPNSFVFVELLLACALIGAWAVPINSRFKARELAYVIANADLHVLFTTDAIDEHVDFVELLGAAFPALAAQSNPARLNLTAAPLLRNIVLIGARQPTGMIGGEAFAAAGRDIATDAVAHRRAQVGPDDVLLMMYTSGTTAHPKGCPLTHGTVTRCALEAGRTRLELVAGDRVWDPLPMFHMSFVLPFAACLDAGAALLSMERFEPALALKYMADEQVTVNFAAFPTITQAFLSHPEFDPARLHFRLINNVAPPELLRSMQAAMPWARQISAYGLTEAGGVVAFSEPGDTPEQRATTQGRPFRGIEVAIRDPDTNVPLPNGTRGEIVLRGYCVFAGYYKDPHKNAACFDADGWFHTGDLGSLDADGRISFLGRAKDMLKVGGENVAAVEIESFLQTHPAVLIAQVVPIADPKYDEVPVAFVQLRPGAAVSEAELIAFSRGAIASFKVPRHVRFVSEWPMSATKIQKFVLRQRIAEELGDNST